MPTDLPTATLGRTGLDITHLGHGAMETRGAPRGHTIIAGTLNPHHLAENIATAQRSALPPDTYA